jgi:hypothetical protein
MIFQLAFGLATATTTILEFNPAVLKLDEFNQNKFQIKLNQKPTEPVQVYFEAKGLEFATCQLDIDTDRYDQWQDVVISGVPVFENRAETNLDIKVRAYQGQTKIDQVYTAQRTPLAGGVCTSVGDPHYKTFDNQIIEYQGVGCFSLFDSKDLQIQATQTYCFGKSSGPSCNQAIAIRYGSTVMALDVRQGIDMKQIAPNVDGVLYTPPGNKDATHTVKLPDGSIINMVVNKKRPFFHWLTKKPDYSWIDVTINVAGGYQKNGGICNRLRNTDQKLYGRQGTPLAAPEFMESYKVSDADNLLLGKYVTSTPYYNAPVATCVLPDAPRPKPQPYPVVVLQPYKAVVTTAPVYNQDTEAYDRTPANEDTAPVYDQDTGAYDRTPANEDASYPKETPAPALPADYKNQVETHCQNLFDDECATVCNKPFYVKACINDAIKAGSLVFAESSKIQYMAQCRLATNYLQHDPEPVVVQKAQAIQQKACLNNYECPNNCSGNGVCGNNGCRCNASFGGKDCSIDLTQLISYNEEKNAYTRATSPSVYTAAGTSSDYSRPQPHTDSNYDSVSNEIPPQGANIVSSATKITLSLLSVVFMFL